MSSAAIALPAATPAKSPKKRAKSQRSNTGPSVSSLILKAAAASSDRSGVSLAVLKKALKSGGYDVVKNRTRILITIKRLLAKKTLVQTKGTGASGSFKLNKKPPTPRKKKVTKKKPKAKRVKKVKKAAGASPAAKKSPKKRKAAKSPKKAAKKSTATKKPAAAKKPAAKKTKKAKSPKKRVKRRVAKTTRTKAAAKK